MTVSTQERAERQLAYWERNLSEKIRWDNETINLIYSIADRSYNKFSDHELNILAFCENSREAEASEL